MQKIVPHLWFEKEAVAAAEFYTSVFPDSKITSKSVIKNTPSGDCDMVGLNLMGYNFSFIAAGPYFKFNPSISFTVSCKDEDQVNGIWAKLIDGGKVLMEVGEYPFSKRYGWLEDKFGVSWQIIVSAEGVAKVGISPFLMFIGDNYGKAEEAMEFYTKVFKNGSIKNVFRYKDQAPDKDGNVQHALFEIEGQEFAIMESAHDHKFSFGGAISFIVNCADQAEIDYYWDKLSADPKAEQCGWIKDKFGVSWQIIPVNMGELLGKNPAKTTPVMLKMKKIVIADLVKAGE